MIGLRERWSCQLHIGPQKFFPSILSHRATCALHEYMRYWNIHPYVFPNFFGAYVDKYSVFLPLQYIFFQIFSVSFYTTQKIGKDTYWMPISRILSWNFSTFSTVLLAYFYWSCFQWSCRSEWFFGYAFVVRLYNNFDTSLTLQIPSQSMTQF